MRIWCISREYQGLAEAGGVKHVTRALCKGLAQRGHKVVLFIPRYGSTKVDNLAGFEEDYVSPLKLKLRSNIDTTKDTQIVHIDKAHIDNIKVLFIRHESFTQKLGIYTWTKKEESIDPRHKNGQGHPDTKFMNILFQKAIAAYWSRGVPPWSIPDIIHCHDATAALVPCFIQELSNRLNLLNFQSPRFIVTIHNAGPGYHHEFSSVEDASYWTMLRRPILEKAKCKEAVEPFLLAANSGAYLTTVSTKYAKELVSPKYNELTGGLSTEFCKRGIKIQGIENGIDFSLYDPNVTSASLLPYAFDPIKKDFAGKHKCRTALLKTLLADNANKELMRYGASNTDTWEAKVWFAFHARMARQKGISIMVQAIRAFLSHRQDAVFIIMGQGESLIEDECRRLAIEHSGNVVFYCGYDRAFSRLCLASANFLLSPSIFEPCGLEDLIASLFGTITLANWTGGLAKIVNGHTGFLYTPNTAQVLEAKIDMLCNIYLDKRHSFDNMQQCAAYNAKYNLSWDNIIDTRYLPLLYKLKKL